MRLDSRVEQLAELSNLNYDGLPLTIHGSLGRAVVMGECLPAESKHDGSLRDIDVFVTGVDKYPLEDFVTMSGVGGPNPVDAGLSMLIVKGSNGYLLSKDDVSVPCDGVEVFDDTRRHVVTELGGISIRTFSPTAMLAASCLEPKYSVRPDHLVTDLRLRKWFKDQKVTLPPRLEASIEDFHHEYKKVYPRKALYECASSTYARFVPESVRSRFRSQTHRFMQKHTGRPSPFA